MWYSPYESITEWALHKASTLSALQTAYLNHGIDTAFAKIYVSKTMILPEADAEKIFSESIKYIYCNMMTETENCAATYMLKAYSNFLEDQEKRIINKQYDPSNEGKTINISIHCKRLCIIRELSLAMPDIMPAAFNTLKFYTDFISDNLLDAYIDSILDLYNQKIASQNWNPCYVEREYARTIIINVLKRENYADKSDICCTSKTTSNFDIFVQCLLDKNRLFNRYQATYNFPKGCTPVDVLANTSITNLSNLGHDILDKYYRCEECKNIVNKCINICPECTTENANNIYEFLMSLSEFFYDPEYSLESACDFILSENKNPENVKVIKIMSDLINASEMVSIDKSAIDKICDIYTNTKRREIAFEDIKIDSDLDDDISMLESQYEIDMRDDSEFEEATEAKKFFNKNKDKDTNEDDDTDADDSKATNDGNEEEQHVPVHGKAKVDKFAKTNMKVSQGIHKASVKTYVAYRKYKTQEQKIDSQLSKIIVNAGKTIIGIDDNTARKRVIGEERVSLVSILKRLLLTYAVFSYSKIGALCILITRFALRKNATEKERIKILTELQNEIEMVDEKIQDARLSDDKNAKEAKYALMRTKQNLENAYKRIKFRSKNTMTIGGIKDATNHIKEIRGQ